ncbi:MAG: hypothetical protein IJZ74_10425 [Clostridia bacterium]|nr:hypothetical protein [Clostridia bacterium]
MQATPVARNYIMLKPVHGAAHGFCRAEEADGQLHLTLRASGLTADLPVRALLLCGGEDGAALNLGLLTVSAQGQSTRHCAVRTTLHCWDALALAADWPHGQLIAAGMLTQPAACAVWQLQQAASRFLSVPQEDSRPAPVLPPPEKTPPPRQSRPSPQSGLTQLNELRWPDCFAALRPYFETLPPCAPFDAPGWRFVRVDLPQGAPAGWCYLGVRPVCGQAEEICWAVPGCRNAPPPALQGYRWFTSPRGDGYWIALQTTADTKTP